MVPAPPPGGGGDGLGGGGATYGGGGSTAVGMVEPQIVKPPAVADIPIDTLWR